MKDTYKDSFNLLCGKKLGSGIHRDVFECRIRQDLVVKVESSDHRQFANVAEMNFWDEYQFTEGVAEWLAPCEYLSPDGRILLQRKVAPIVDAAQMPDKLPAFLTDLKVANFGMLNGKVVCVDYALYRANISSRMIKVRWDR